MLEAKDTVMSADQIESHMDNWTMIDNQCVAEGTDRPAIEDMIVHFLDNQAEISFRVGYDKALSQLADMTEECKQMGRKEVVKWVEREFGVDWTNEQEQLKKWGVKDD